MEGRPHPYIPNSAPGKKEELLEEIGIESVEEIFDQIPDHLRFEEELDIPEGLKSEHELREHIENILAENDTASEYTSFLGGGTWNHFVPSVCNTIAARDEFLTTYQRRALADHGKLQALFEAQSMIGDLVEMDAVTTPTYDWGNAAAFALRMTHRITGRSQVIAAGTTSPERLDIIENYCAPEMEVITTKYDQDTGRMDLEDLKNKLNSDVAAVYFENPSFLGFIETKAGKIANLAREVEAEVVVGVDPSSLGILASPASYGADMACGDLQPFGIHSKWGGGLAGFIASGDDEKYVGEYPNLLYGITGTIKEDQYGFGKVSFDRTSYAEREEGKDYVGTATALYGIIAGVYLALMGPEGMRELGEGIMQKVSYARRRLSSIEGVNPYRFDSKCFKEFVVEFPAGTSVQEINRELQARNIFGGHSLEKQFSELENCALYSLTEVNTIEEIEHLAAALEEILP